MKYTWCVFGCAALDVVFGTRAAGDVDLLCQVGVKQDDSAVHLLTGRDDLLIHQLCVPLAEHQEIQSVDLPWPAVTNIDDVRVLPGGAIFLDGSPVARSKFPRRLLVDPSVYGGVAAAKALQKAWRYRANLSVERDGVHALLNAIRDDSSDIDLQLAEQWATDLLV
jgi:hypothetical protein